MNFRWRQSAYYLHYLQESLAVLVRDRRRGKRLLHPASSVSRIIDVFFLHRGYTSIVVAALFFSFVAVLAAAVEPLVFVAEEPISFVPFPFVGVEN